MNTVINKPRRGRPPKTHGENRDTRAELIRSGVETLTEFGFASTGIDSILKKVGVPKGSFYHYFNSKEDFGKAVIESYACYFAKKLDLCLLNTQLSPIERIVAFSENAKAGMAKHGFRRGCLIGNLGQEIGLLPESFRQLLQTVFSVWQNKVAECLELAKEQHLIAPHSHCHELAEFFWIGWEGAVMRAKLFESEKPLDSYIQTFVANLPR